LIYTQVVAERQKMTLSIKMFWTGTVTVLIMGGILALFWNKLPPQLPWLYSFPWGEKQLITKLWLVWIFLGMEIVLFLTRLMASWAGKGDTTVQNTIMIGVFVAVILMGASFFRVMMIFLNL
jgi:cytochrome c biogenesis protein CcdA